MIQDQTTIESSVPAVKPLPQNDRIDTILLRIDAIRSEQGFGTYVLGVAGCDRLAGVSTIAGNLASRAAQLGMGPVLLVDGNLAHPRQAVNFGLRGQNGLADYLAGEFSARDVVHNGKLDGLDVMPAGSPKHAQHVAIVPELVENLMREMRRGVPIDHCRSPTRPQFRPLANFESSNGRFDVCGQCSGNHRPQRGFGLGNAPGMWCRSHWQRTESSAADLAQVAGSLVLVGMTRICRHGAPYLSRT